MTAVATGSATISARYSGQTSTTNFTATPAVLVSIEVATTTPSVAARIGANFTARGVYSHNTHKDLTSQASWASSDTAVATIASDGRATTLFIGGTPITAALGDVSGSMTLNVSAALLVSLAVGPTGASVPKGLTQQFGATGTFTDMSTQNLTAQDIWVSSNIAVATVPMSVVSSNSVCTANATTGSLSACSASALAFSPIGLAVRGTSALIGDDSNNIYACAVSGSGALSACTKTVTEIGSSIYSWLIAIH